MITRCVVRPLITLLDYKNNSFGRRRQVLLLYQAIPSFDPLHPRS